MNNPHHATPSGKARARALSVPFDGTPGANNAITDVAGLEVGYCTVVRGDGPLVAGQGPVRTGVTAILPRGRSDVASHVFAASHSLNGCGELTGTLWIEESGICEGPITITNTHACGVARDATLRWLIERHPDVDQRWHLPVAGETYDGELNDINGFHVTPEHVYEALESARAGAIELGSVGGGTGMICYDFKGGSGSASRLLTIEGESYTLGAFVQANFGLRRELVVAGVPVGRHITGGELCGKPAGSVIAVIATDAPLLPHQLKRLARRVGLGLARSGALAHNGSGDIFLALSTANRDAFAAAGGPRRAAFLPNEQLDPLFEAVVQATDEAVIDSMVANETMVGRDGNTAIALPHDRLRELLARYGRGPDSPGD
jgi:L-aminopeptidase/D-esterase-like protein